MYKPSSTKVVNFSTDKDGSGKDSDNDNFDSKENVDDISMITPDSGKSDDAKGVKNEREPEQGKRRRASSDKNGKICTECGGSCVPVETKGKYNILWKIFH